ncbi:MAG: deoxyribose-phosphate aldolase [Marinisporobacter sp.]|jgi:deoxyribose-phosphate aldolase|nr:deoxyribose-phosphate aldolase [Marinisporobacter sp.]
MKNIIDFEEIGKIIDISAVRTDVTVDEIDQMVEVAKKYRFICAFAMPCFTKKLIEMLKDEEDIMVGGVVGFPSGADTTSIKVATAKEMKQLGCNELDMVINVGALKSGKYDIVKDDIKAIVEAGDGLPVKSILEISYLTDDEIARGSEIAVKAGVSYVKTGTGWGNIPTTVDTIKLIKGTIGNSAKIKAAGGVRDLDTVIKMVEAGCSRFGIGLNSAIKIMDEANRRMGNEAIEHGFVLAENESY